MHCAVVVPWRAGCPHRERAWSHVRRLYAEKHPGWGVIEALGPNGPWSKGSAVNPVLAEVDAEVVVVADADVWTEGLETAVYAIVCGATWAMPHQKLHRLTEDGTEAVLNGEPWGEQPLAQRAYNGVWGGGIVVGQRDVLLDCPLDPRFRGWGQDDTSWALALTSLHGPGWRGGAPLWHLWHPPQERLTRQKGSREGWQLHTRYHRARRNPVAMRELIEEGKEATWASHR
jgi:hypothetical protein